MCAAALISKRVHAKEVLSAEVAYLDGPSVVRDVAALKSEVLD